MIMSPHPIGLFTGLPLGRKSGRVSSNGRKPEQMRNILDASTLEDSGVGVESKSVERPSQTWSFKFAVNSINGMIVTRYFAVIFAPC